MRQLYDLGVDEVSFVVEAIEHYCNTCCPLANGEGTCAMLGWRESIHTGALERVCRAGPGDWKARLGAHSAIRPIATRGKAWA